MSDDFEPRTERVRLAVAGARAATHGSLTRQPGSHLIRNRVFLTLLLLAIGIALMGLALLLIDAFVEGRSRLSLNLISIRLVRKYREVYE